MVVQLAVPMRNFRETGPEVSVYVGEGPTHRPFSGGRYS